jgi:hypothetical protein
LVSIPADSQIIARSGKCCQSGWANIWTIGKAKKQRNWTIGKITFIARNAVLINQLDMIILKLRNANCGFLGRIGQKSKTR